MLPDGNGPHQYDHSRNAIRQQQPSSTEPRDATMTLLMALQYILKANLKMLPETHIVPFYFGIRQIGQTFLSSMY
jgi:hypothetical protein